MSFNPNIPGHKIYGNIELTGGSIYASSLSGGTIYSGSTPLNQIFATTGNTFLPTNQIGFGSAFSGLSGSSGFTYNDVSKVFAVSPTTFSFRVTDWIGYVGVYMQDNATTLTPFNYTLTSDGPNTYINAPSSLGAIKFVVGGNALRATIDDLITYVYTGFYTHSARTNSLSAATLTGGSINTQSNQFVVNVGQVNDSIKVNSNGLIEFNPNNSVTRNYNYFNTDYLSKPSGQILYFLEENLSYNQGYITYGSSVGGGIFNWLGAFSAATLSAETGNIRSGLTIGHVDNGRAYVGTSPGSPNFRIVVEKPGFGLHLNTNSTYGLYLADSGSQTFVGQFSLYNSTPSLSTLAFATAAGYDYDTNVSHKPLSAISVSAETAFIRGANSLYNFRHGSLLMGPDSGGNYLWRADQPNALPIIGFATYFGGTTYPAWFRSNSASFGSTTLQSLNVGAYVNIAGSVSNRASLEIDSGSTVSNPYDGDIWNDGQHLYGKFGGVVRQLDNDNGSGTTFVQPNQIAYGSSVSGITYSSGLTYANNGLTITSPYTSVLRVVGSGTTQPIFSVQGSQGELFSVTDDLSGSLFSVNDISGLPIVEVFSDGTTLIGDYQAPGLYTSKNKTLTAGTNTVYLIPTSAYTGAFFDYTVIGTSGARAGSIMSIWSGVSVNYTEVTTNDIGQTSGVTFTMSISGSYAVLNASGSTSGWIVKTIIRSI